jgi:hypothetical protein
MRFRERATVVLPRTTEIRLCAMANIIRRRTMAVVRLAMASRGRLRAAVQKGPAVLAVR